MNSAPLVEKAQAYMNLQLTHLGALDDPDPPRPFVTISRESGANGTAMAEALARHLPALRGHPWKVYSGNLIDEMLRSNDVPAHVAQYLPEDRISELGASVGEMVGLHPNLWTLVRKTNDLMRELARAGHAILLGRAANFATAGLANGVHLRLVAPASVRAVRTAGRRGLTVGEAADYNAERDAARQRYVRANFDADVTAADAYHVVANVAVVPTPVIVEMVTHLLTVRTRAAA